MGGGRDKRKKNKPTTAGLGAEKTSKKTDKNADKATRRLERKAQVGCVLHALVPCGLHAHARLTPLWGSALRDATEPACRSVCPQPGWRG